MKLFINNSEQTQKILFLYGFNWGNSVNEVRYLDIPFITFDDTDPDLRLYYFTGPKSNLIRNEYTEITTDQIIDIVRRMIVRIDEKDDVFLKIPEGVTKFTYKNVEYERRWVKVQK